MRYDAFISYRRDNGFHMARIIRDYLESKDLVPFMDLHDIHEGQFDIKILDAIADAENFILILSPESMDRCINENDWVRQEIKAAVELNKNIIPIRQVGFQWPDNLMDQLPESVKRMEKEQSIDENPSYFDEMLSRVYQRLKNVKPASVSIYGSHNMSSTGTTERYFSEQRLLGVNNITQLDMAFHAGTAWFQEPKKLELLIDSLVSHNVRVLINTPEVAEGVAQHMRMRRLKYIPFAEGVKFWKELIDDGFSSLSVRLVDIPLMRRYYSFHMIDKSQDSVNVKHYTYGNSNIEKNYQSILTPQSNYFQLYRREFDFLWNKSIDIRDYLK